MSKFIMVLFAVVLSLVLFGQVLAYDGRLDNAGYLVESILAQRGYVFIDGQTFVNPDGTFRVVVREVGTVASKDLSVASKRGERSLRSFSVVYPTRVTFNGNTKIVLAGCLFNKPCAKY